MNISIYFCTGNRVNKLIIEILEMDIVCLCQAGISNSVGMIPQEQNEAISHSYKIHTAMTR